MPEVAYFSPEFGVSEDLPQYSGGLGVLAGDYLKVCAAEGRPLVGVGLFYHLGYFHQRLGGDGWQQEAYREQVPEQMGLEAVPGDGVEIDLGDRVLRARVWRQTVGSIPLYLLDTLVAGNPEDLCQVTDRLYGGDLEHRLRQEMLLGMGGVRALRGAGASPAIFHSNEGHAGFLVLERVRELVEEGGLRFEEALEAVRAGTVFTTHTPVPAGIDRFPVELMRRYFGRFCERLGIPLERLMALGHFPSEPWDDPFNMAVLGLRMSGQANAVSELHRTVSQRMFHGLWPDLLAEEVPIKAVTNGVDARSWASAEMRTVLDAHLGPRWDVAQGADFSPLLGLTDPELWAARQPGRRRLIAAARSRLRAAELERGVPETELGWTDEALDEGCLTIGFARRVAEYKRGALLFSQPERLRRLLRDRERPVQLIIAGKAHPRDDQGKHIIQALATAAHDPELRRRLVFLEDYDLALARLMYQGADVWLNTPRRPMEACGTSGQKATLSGALNLSILDGWWDEAYREGNGFAIPSFEEVTDRGERDRLEAEALFQLLEEQVVPLFHERGAEGLPHRWLDCVRNSLVSVAPFVLGSRMLADYATLLYAPAAELQHRLAVDHHLGARQLAHFRARVRREWPRVNVKARSLPPQGLARGVPVGSARTVEAVVELGDLVPEQVRVQLLHGPVTGEGELAAPAVEEMALDGDGGGCHHRYLGKLVPRHPGRYGFAVRVLAASPITEPPVPESPVRLGGALRLRQ